MDHRIDIQILYSGHSGGRHGSTEGGLLHRLRLYDGDRVVSRYIAWSSSTYTIVLSIIVIVSVIMALCVRCE